MAKIYSPNENYNSSAGNATAPQATEFFNGVGYTTDAVQIKWFKDKGYTVDEVTTEGLNVLDKLPKDTVIEIATLLNVNITEMTTKKDIIVAIRA
jgi:hypothetical protein